MEHNAIAKSKQTFILQIRHKRPRTILTESTEFLNYALPKSYEVKVIYCSGNGKDFSSILAFNKGIVQMDREKICNKCFRPVKHS